MSLDLRQLRYFIAVADELHFGRAAARLHIVQPALSMQIKALEQYLGAELLTRSRQHVALTPVGTAFLQEARRVVAQAEHAEAVGRRAADGQIGLLRVGYIGSAPFSGVLPRAISLFVRDFPDVELRLEELTMYEQVQRLRDGALDVGFVRLPLSSAAGMDVVRLARERIMVALPSAHPLAGETAIAPAALRDERFIMASGQADAGLARVIWRIFEKGGFVPVVAQTVAHIATVVALVEAGLGVALVPQSLTAMRVGTITYRYLSDVDDVSEIALVAMTDNRSRVTLNFVDSTVAVSKL
jgi:DNA-binding transcriptional LysR family regulator